MTPATAIPERPRRIRKHILRFLLAMLVMATLVGVYKYRQLHSTPIYWDEQITLLDGLSDQQRQTVSENFRNRILDKWSDWPQDIPTHKLTEDSLIGDQVTIELPFDELNIWLNTEARETLKQQGSPLPEKVGQMILGSKDGMLVAYIEYAGGTSNVFSITLDIQIDNDGKITSTLEHFHVGELELPRSSATSFIHDQIVGFSDKMNPDPWINLLTGEPFGPIEILIDPTDSGVRDGRIVGLEIGDQSLFLTRQTVPRHASPQ